MKNSCFVCGSTNLDDNGKCLDCGYEFEYTFPCPYHDEQNNKCRATRKRCNKRLDYFECSIYLEV